MGKCEIDYLYGEVLTGHVCSVAAPCMYMMSIIGQDLQILRFCMCNRVSMVGWCYLEVCCLSF
jgi:hypothetical protein